MGKKMVLLLAAVSLLLGGCQSAKRIETASVIENVSVHEDGGQRIYTFYLLTEGPRADTVSVPAASFEEAQTLAERSYIPHLNLAKLELLLIHQNVSGAVIRRDLEYISGQAYFSPIAYLALCDGATLRRLKQTAGSRQLIENQIDRLGQDHPHVKTDYLSVFNACERGASFEMPLITCRGDLKAEAVLLDRLP